MPAAIHTTLVDGATLAARLDAGALFEKAA